MWDLIKYERLRSPTIKDTLVPALQKNGYLDEKGLMAKWNEEELSQIVTDLLYDSYDVEGGKKIVMGVLRNSYMLDNSKYAGPSGAIGSIGDLARVSVLGSSGVVFTAVGFYTDEAGNVDRSKLKVNADFYFADGEGPNTGKPVVVDMGVMVVDV